MVLVVVAVVALVSAPGAAAAAPDEYRRPPPPTMNACVWAGRGQSWTRHPPRRLVVRVAIVLYWNQRTSRRLPSFDRHSRRSWW